jgi:hypothetical protein
MAEYVNNASKADFHVEMGPRFIHHCGKLWWACWGVFDTGKKRKAGQAHQGHFPLFDIDALGFAYVYS